MALGENLLNQSNHHHHPCHPHHRHHRRCRQHHHHDQMTNITVHRIHLNRGPQVKIGEVIFRHAQLCDRCDFTQV